MPELIEISGLDQDGTDEGMPLIATTRPGNQATSEPSERKGNLLVGLVALGVIVGGVIWLLSSRPRQPTPRNRDFMFGFEGGMLADLGVIVPCRKKDRTSKKPVRQQKWCLWDSKKKKILGRHPSESKAKNQEKAIQARKRR